MNRRVFFRKVLGPSDEDQLDPFVSYLLAAPVEKEAELLEAVRKSGGDESVAKAVATVVRAADGLREPYGDGFRDAIVKAAIDVIDPKPEPVWKTAPKPAPQPAKSKRTTDESLAELRRVGKSNERYFDSKAEEDLDRQAERIRRESGYDLSKAQAVVKAIDENADLYEAARRHNLRKAGVLDDHPNTIAKAEADQAALDRAADKVLAREPDLTRAQAITKALEADPALYEAPR
jgi:hypothetical protein